MAMAQEYRLRIWRTIEQRRLEGTDVIAAAREAISGDPGKAATVETDHGAGPVLVVAIATDTHTTDYFGDPYDPDALLLRVWEVEDAFEDIGGVNGAGFVLSDIRQGLWDEGHTEIRLLTAEDNTEDGDAVIVAASWYDPDDFGELDWEECTLRRSP